MWRCWYCSCTNGEEWGRCQYCSGPRRDARKEAERGEFKWTYDDDRYYDSPYYFKSGMSTRHAIGLYVNDTYTIAAIPDYADEKEVEELEEDAYFAPAPAPKRWKIFNFFRKER